jgi:hypothetical protein
MRKLFILAGVLGAFVASNAYAIPNPCDCFGGIDINLSPTYWYLLDENGYPLQNGDWVYVAWKGPDGITDPPKKTEPNCGDVTGDDVILREGTIYYGSFTIGVTTFAPEDGQHPWTGEEIYCRIFNEPKYPACATGYYGESDQHVVENVLGEVFFAKFAGDPFQGYTDWPLPIELISFDAIGMDSRVLLEWRTATESNIVGFHIERSLDAVDFERITQELIPGVGDSTTGSTYSHVDSGVVNGTTYYYNLITVDRNSVEQVANTEPVAATPGETTVLVTPSAYVPETFALRQNYPNPFNPVTEITYAIPRNLHVILRVYNVLGGEVATLVDDDQPVGIYTVRWDAEGLPSGVYFCTIRAGDFKSAKKMILLK